MGTYDVKLKGKGLSARGLDFKLQHAKVLSLGLLLERIESTVEGCRGCGCCRDVWIGLKAPRSETYS